MPLTQLDPTAALVVIDLQRGITGNDLAHPAQDVIDHSAQLARGFRAHGLPVVLVNVTGLAPGRTDAAGSGGGGREFPPDFAVLVDELEQQPGDHLVTKRTWGAFTGTDLDAILREAGATQVVLTGIATSAGVESTARFAHELGYHVVLVQDAMTDRTAEVHDHRIDHVFGRLGEVTTTAEVLAQLDRR